MSAERKVPVAVTVVPPAIDPPVGLSEVTVGVVSIGVTELDVPAEPSPIAFVATTANV